MRINYAVQLCLLALLSQPFMICAEETRAKQSNENRIEDKNNYKAFSRIGWIHCKKDRYDKAIKCFEKAYTISHERTYDDMARKLKSLKNRTRQIGDFCHPTVPQKIRNMLKRKTKADHRV